MNTAARMAQHSEAGCIHVTEDVVGLAPDHCWEKLRKMDVKGKGSMQTYLLRVSSDEIEGSATMSDQSASAGTADFMRANAFSHFFIEQKDESSLRIVSPETHDTPLLERRRKFLQKFGKKLRFRNFF